MRHSNTVTKKLLLLSLHVWLRSCDILFFYFKHVYFSVHESKSDSKTREAQRAKDLNTSKLALGAWLSQIAKKKRRKCTCATPSEEAGLKTKDLFMLRRKDKEHEYLSQDKLNLWLSHRDHLRRLNIHANFNNSSPFDYPQAVILKKLKS